MSGYALLAPVPKLHVDSALEVLKAKEFVCFGSDSWEVFTTLDIGTKTYIYVSHADGEGEIAYEAKFCGTKNKLGQTRY